MSPRQNVSTNTLATVFIMWATVPSVLNNPPSNAPNKPNTTAPITNPFVAAIVSALLKIQPKIAPRTAPSHPYVTDPLRLNDSGLLVSTLPSVGTPVPAASDAK